MGDSIKYMTVFCPVAFVIGDGKSSDMLCCRRATKSKCRVSRYCVTPAHKLDDPTHVCEGITMEHLKNLVVTANDESTTAAERKKACSQLFDLSTHNVYNAFFDIDFGSNPFGIITAATPDLMHMFELGILKYILRIFIDTMPPRIRAQVDEHMDKMFVGTRSSEKKESLRYDFTRGATSLTLLNAHHWPGLTMAFMVMLLTKEGQGICGKTCFTGEEAIVPEIDPSTITDLLGEPTELSIEEMLEGLSIHQPAHPAGTGVEATHTEGELLLDENTSDREDGETSEEDESGPEEEDDPDTHLEVDVEADIEPPPKKKRKVSQPLPCTLEQFVLLLERLLIFHAWYKNGSSITLLSTDEEKREISLKIRNLMQSIRCVVPREAGYGWQLQKFHDLLHILLAMIQFGDTDNFDASHGERLLKYWVKHPGITCQKRGQHRFLQQMSDRIAESLCLREAHMSKAALATRSLREAVQVNREDSFLVGSPSCRVQYTPDSGNIECLWMRKAKKQRIRCLHPCVMDYVKRNFRRLNQTGDSIFFYTEAKHHGVILRAHPDYTKSGSGPWYDFATIRYEENRQGVQDYPARLLAFFKVTDENGSDDNYAIIQSTQYVTENEVTCRRKLHQTDIASRWEMETTRGRRTKRNGEVVTCFKPRIRCVSLKAIQSGSLVFEEDPGIRQSTNNPQIVWALSDRKDEWHRHF